MSDLDDLVGAISGALSAIAAAQRAALHAASGFAEAVDTLTPLTAGSAIADIPGLYGRARSDVEQQVRSLEVTAEGLRRYVASLSWVENPAAPQGAPPQKKGDVRGVGAATGQPKPGPVPEDRVDELRSELPPRVQPRGGQKTHGQWVSGSGGGDAGRIVSGRDDMEAEAAQFLKDQGVRRMPSTVADVEVKLAVHMENRGITNATVAINNEVCVGPFSCDTLLPKILSQGSSLTVYGTMPDGQPTGTTYLGQRKKP
uniref:DddA-like double-stranded DNA deaminase toxin n=1 Tax=Amycolatopsis sp. CA-096443 TaxID=3239919 RepID=UPI003F49A875